MPSPRWHYPEVSLHLFHGADSRHMGLQEPFQPEDRISGPLALFNEIHPPRGKPLGERRRDFKPEAAEKRLIFLFLEQIPKL